MKKIKLKTARVTGSYETQTAGQEIEVTDNEAKRMIEMGQAVEVAPAPTSKRKSKATKKAD